MKWPTIPIEVEPLAADVVLSELRLLGSPDPSVRPGHISKAGPIKTDQDNFIIDAPFPTMLLPADISGSSSDSHPRRNVKGWDGAGLWEVSELANKIKLIEGVLSVGLFVGINGAQAAVNGKRAGGQKPIAAYFGMEDGTVMVREANEDGTARVRKGWNEKWTSEQ